MSGPRALEIFEPFDVGTKDLRNTEPYDDQTKDMEKLEPYDVGTKGLGNVEPCAEGTKDLGKTLRSWLWKGCRNAASLQDKQRNQLLQKRHSRSVFLAFHPLQS